MRSVLPALPRSLRAFRDHEPVTAPGARSSLRPRERIRMEDKDKDTLRTEATVGSKQSGSRRYQSDFSTIWVLKTSSWSRFTVQ